MTQHKELEELEKYLSMKKNFMKLRVTGFDMNLAFYGKDREPRGCMNRDGKFLRKAIAQAEQRGFNKAIKVLEQSYYDYDKDSLVEYTKERGLDFAIKKLKK